MLKHLDVTERKTVGFRLVYFKKLSRTTSNRSCGADRLVTRKHESYLGSGDMGSGVEDGFARSSRADLGGVLVRF